jgi:type I restriction enzyme S subunit
VNRHWAIRLRDVVDSIDYGVTASATLEPGPKFLRITDIQDGGVNWETVPNCIAPERKLDGAVLRDGDIVFARTGATTGKSFLIQDPPTGAVFASYLIRVRPSDRMWPAYLAHYFRSPGYWSQIEARSQGAAQEGVNATKLADLEVPLPPLDEQRRIAAILDKADALRQKRKRAIALLDSLTQSIFLKMFGNVEANDRQWRDGVRLDEVAEIGSGITKGRPDRGLAVRSVPYMAVANVQERKLDLSTVKSIDASEAEISRFRLEYNDLLLTEGGDPDKLGRGTLWRTELPEAIHQNHIFRVRFNSADVVPLFANWLIGSVRGKRYFLQSAKQTTGIASINKTQLSSFPMLVPPLEIQQLFADRAGSVQRQLDAFAQAASDAERLFASLQHRAFSGQL